MEFTKENWENAPEGARLEFNYAGYWEEVHLVGYKREGFPVFESENGIISQTLPRHLRIILPKRKVTVQLWDSGNGLRASVDNSEIKCWTLLGEHTFEIEGE